MNPDLASAESSTATDGVSPYSTWTRRSAVRAIMLGGFVAGTIDIGAACAINALSPIVILHAIASGVLGAASFRMGTPSAVLGLILQWVMSFIIATIYSGAARLQPPLARRWAWAGAIYGVVTFFVMNYVVMPLSAVGHRPTFSTQTFLENMLAMIWFGLVIAYFAHDSFARSINGQVAPTALARRSD
jgi:uncharacterized membrane protein YagU involved in acid resistance